MPIASQLALAGLEPSASPLYALFMSSLMSLVTQRVIVHEFLLMTYLTATKSISVLCTHVMAIMHRC